MKTLKKAFKKAAPAIKVVLFVILAPTNTRMAMDVVESDW